MKGGKKTKDNSRIALEWDKLSKFRMAQLENHEDISMDEIIIPTVFELATNTNTSNVIDLGCGTGYATQKFAKIFAYITGIDISKESIYEANTRNENCSNIQFLHCSIEEFPSKYSKTFSLAISNMTFMDVPELEKVLEATSKLIILGGHLIITITHPYFWPFYWEYSNEDWFNYSEEIEIEEYFRISKSKTEFKTTHFHRPLESYINALVNNRFMIKNIIEPLPSKTLSQLYPTKWKFPRFLAIKCEKI